jgi:LysR family transcriptional regulator, transcriptional activator for bauABCD operon
MFHARAPKRTSKGLGHLVIGRVSDIDLRLLRIFATVVESGGFAVATAKLNVAESTVSQHMSDLEKRVGMRLCERGRSGFRLTKNGEEFYQATSELLGDLNRFRDKIAGLSSTVSGRFSIGLPDAIASLPDSPVAKGLRAFSQRAPDLHLQIAMLSPRELERQVIDGKINVAIAPAHRRVAGLDYHPFLDETNLLYCAKGHPLFPIPDERIGAADIEAGGRISRGYLERFDAAFFESDHYAATVHETEAAAMLILTGRYIGFLPDHYAAQWVKTGGMRAVQPARYRFEAAFHLISKREGAGDPRITLFFDCLTAGVRG